MTKELSVATTYYERLGIPPSATLDEIKAAYRRVLLSSHPDKRASSVSHPKDFDVAQIQDAYRVLSDAEARTAYDASRALNRLNVGDSSCSLGPRPAQVVSLEEFSSVELGSSAIMAWTYACRCGGTYSITELAMEENRHLIACDHCSEVIYVGYEVVEENEATV